ncbi:TonB family protein, partial [candidate division WOR-3 bacterium]|nr:TonB family protein [candidate division WOR-3 bacterium]
IGLSASIILHILIFIIFQYIISFNIEKPKEFRGSITVTLEKVVPEEGMIKNTAVQKKSVTPTYKKHKKEKSETVQKVVKEEVQKPIPQRKSADSQSISKNVVKAPNLLRNKPSNPIHKYSESSTGEVEVNLRKGEVKTLSREEARVPVIPQGVKEKEKEKPLPFQPGVEVEQAPLAFNVGELENKSTEDSSGIKNAQAGGQINPQIKKAKEIEGVEGESIKSNSMIEWEKGAQIRKVISMGPKPHLPDWVKKEGLKLKVTLVFKVTPNGYVTDVNVSKSSGYSDVDASVIESVRRIVFQPVNSDRADTGKITYIIEPK